VIFGVASLLATLAQDPGQLIACRGLMGVGGSLLMPSTLSLLFTVFPPREQRKAMAGWSMVAMVGVVAGPTVGGVLLNHFWWGSIFWLNVPIAVLAIIGVRFGIAEDDAAELHRDPADIAGAVLGTATIVLALVAPTLFVHEGTESWVPWATTAAAVMGAVLFVLRERSARYPLLDLTLVAHPLVSSGLAFKAAAGLATAGLGYLVTLQLQLDWGWTPALAAIGMLPQVVVLIAGGAFIKPLMQRIGLERAAWLSAAVVVFGLAVYGLLSRFGYVWVAVALVLVAAGMRVVGVVAGVNVLRGLPKSRTTIGAALTDTATEVTSGVGIAVTGTILAALFTGDIATTNWSTRQTAEFREAVTIAGLALTVVAAALVGWGVARTRRVTNAFIV
jgi:MFS family permease